MSALIPPAVNYPSSLISVRSRLQTDPPEGPRSVPAEIDWATMGGTNHCVNFNVQNNSTNPLSQIVALKIDNSQCGSDIQFIFTDTSEVVTIPAYSPLVIVPVFTNQVQFFVVALGEEPVDITRFQILNFVPPPIAVPTSQEQNTAINNNLPLASVTTTTQLIAAGISGTLEVAQIQVGLQTAPSITFSSTFFLNDGDGKPLGAGVLAGADAPQTGFIINLQNVSLRFHNGVSLTQGGGAAVTGFLAYNLLYRTP